MFIMPTVLWENVNIIMANRVDKLPNFVSFKRLSDHMRNIDIGSVLYIHPVFTDGLQ